MTDEDIEEYRQELVCILQNEKSKREEKYSALIKLARKVGAGEYIGAVICQIMESIKQTCFDEERHAFQEAHIAEIVSNIHSALQTAAMVNMCRTAAKNYDIALNATKTAIKHYWIAGMIAILSMLAAWAAVLVRA